jgi:hypothetical protein
MYNLVSTITQLPSMVGCQEFPNTPQGMALIKLIQDFINEEYHYSGETVRKAFMLAAKQELYLDGKRIDASTFGQHLSVNVVGKVLTAYKEHIRKGNARPQGYNPNQLPEAPVKRITPAEAHDLILKWTKQERKLPFGAPYHLAYLYLLENKLVKEAAKIKHNRFKTQEDVELKLAQDWYQKNCLH